MNIDASFSFFMRMKFFQRSSPIAARIVPGFSFRCGNDADSATEIVLRLSSLPFSVNLTTKAPSTVGLVNRYSLLNFSTSMTLPPGGWLPRFRPAAPPGGGTVLNRAIWGKICRKSMAEDCAPPPAGVDSPP